MGALHVVPAMVVRPNLMMVDETGDLLRLVVNADGELGHSPTGVKVMTELTRSWHDKLKSREEVSRLWGEVEYPD